jgi:(p)ppGpp synthase/HD superfamily hydrolase
MEKVEFIAVGMLKNKNMESQLIQRARQLAFSYHENQKYGSHPYSYHLESVVELVKLYSYMIPKNLKEEAICAAYLHDILEDTICTEDEILRALNPKILLIVKLLTKKESNLEKYFTRISLDEIAIFVKLCDRYSNILESIKEKNNTKLTKYKEQNPLFIRILLYKKYSYLIEEIKKFFKTD